MSLTHSKRLRRKKFLALSNWGISKKLIKSWPLLLASLRCGELVDRVHQVRPLVPWGELCQQVRHPLRRLLVPNVGVAHLLPVVGHLLLAVLPTVTTHPAARDNWGQVLDNMLWSSYLSCFFLCRIRACLIVNFLLQMSHANGLLLTWRRMCFRSSLVETNWQGQKIQLTLRQTSSSFVPAFFTSDMILMALSYTSRSSLNASGCSSSMWAITWSLWMKSWNSGVNFDQISNLFNLTISQINIICQCQ